jgi:hypothetical protein
VSDAYALPARLAVSSGARRMNLSPIEETFSAFLADLWDGPFDHSYEMPTAKGSASHWHRWRSVRGEIGKWSCRNLRHAADQYSWDYITLTQGNGTSRECRNAMIDALRSSDEAMAKAACRTIFKWGGVGKSENDPSRIWVEQSAKEGRLIPTIRDAIDLLNGSDNPADSFDGKKLLMNSAMTKIYAFADPDQLVPIYDGRVGAALGRLVAHFCQRHNIAFVPDELAFAWLDGRSRKNGRNPSRAELMFPRLGKSYVHAKSAWRASRILKNAAETITCSVTDLEQALFMIGYDVRKVEA